MAPRSRRTHAPSFFFDLELTNVLCKKILRNEIVRTDADAILGQLPSLPLKRQPEAPFLVSAFDLASQTQRTVYDCLYLAMAVQFGGRMVTAEFTTFHSLSAT